MPRILAIDWDRHEVRGVLVSAGPTGTSVSGAWAASLATSDPAGLSGKQIGARLAAAMGGAVSGKVTTLVGVGRDNVQMKLLSLPPAPPDELPDLVRFQAEREFTALGTDAALDFIPLSGDAQTPNQVLALALSPAGMTEAREVCEALGVEPDRIPVRGCAAAALVNRAGLIDRRPGRARRQSAHRRSRPRRASGRDRRLAAHGAAARSEPSRKPGSARCSAKFAARWPPCGSN